MGIRPGALNLKEQRQKMRDERNKELNHVFEDFANLTNTTAFRTVNQRENRKPMTYQEKIEMFEKKKRRVLREREEIKEQVKNNIEVLQKEKEQAKKEIEERAKILEDQAKQNKEKFKYTKKEYKVFPTVKFEVPGPGCLVNRHI